MGEARLFCDLSRSFITFLLHEHTRLVGKNSNRKINPGSLQQTSQRPLMNINL
ncbi:hypothetical protein SAMN05216247_102116 [Pseudomonas salomonii]|uniref:Uncharacterized protein n=1 Tax=Pseudomonas salomonii TaxID=191391 RepID=A0A1H3FET5_9PSED|nr:hypothetical protein SAMN05216247_102116 [Pseudomonas salomonii]